jgi:hypothetical protein
MVQLDEVYFGKALPKTSNVLRPTTVHHDDLEWRGILLRQHGSQTVINERLADDGRDDDRDNR